MKIQEYEMRIDANTKMFIEQFGQLDITKMNRKAGPDKWSIAQNIEHLINVNTSYFEGFEALLSNTYASSFMSRFGLYARFCGQFILKGVSEDRRRKIKTFPIWQVSNIQIENILYQFEKSQETMKQYIARCAECITNKTIISSPAHKHIVYPLDIALEIIITHQKRHYIQAIELL